MEFQILGPLRVTHQSREVEIGAPKLRSLLAMLLVHLNEPVSVDVLTEVLWGTQQPAGATNTLQAYVSRLRGLLEPERSPRSPGDLLITREPGYLLRLDPERLDARRFERLAREGKAHLRASEAAAAGAVLREALSLWRGGALADFAYESFSQPEIRRLEELRMAAIEDRIDADLAHGDHEGLVAELEALTQQHPFRERLWGQLMLALYRSGRQADALGAYREAGRVLGEELGLEPGPELRALEERILLHDAALELGPVDRSARATLSATRLPSGVVTFLFTGIEGAADLWEQHPQSMPAVLDRYEELFTHTATTHHGSVFQRSPAGVCAVFGTAGNALVAAVEAQRALAAESWGATGPLRVRSALHSGTATAEAGDYRGPTAMRCSRLLEVAHGGQMLVSATAADLGRDALGEGVELVDLGAHLLPNATEPEHLFQLVHPELPAEFPPLPTAQRPLTNLPAALSSFVGRAAELAEVEALLADTRLLTLVGAGGTGKTRLALQTGAQAVARYPDGVWLVELAAVARPELLATAIAHQLGLRQRPTEPVIETVLRHLADQRLLLILDNCEHLIEAAAEFAGRALRAGSGLSMLATSRERLSVDGEVVWQVPPLSLPDSPDEAAADTLLATDAVRLFAERGAQARPGFRVGGDNVRSVAQMCRRLDGMPLAIELAAARLRAFSIADIATRLDDRFRLLTGGARTALPRHQTLGAAVDWSYDLLTQEEQRLFRSLSVFAGAFTIEAVEAVAGKPGGGLPVPELLARLVDKSLVVVDSFDEVAHFKLLETLRIYGQERLLEAGEAETTSRRHAVYYLELAEAAAAELRGPEQAGWFRRLETDHDNLRKALERALDEGTAVETAARLAVALRDLWHVHGHWREARHWLDLCMDAAGELPSDLQGQLHHAAGVFAALRRDYSQAVPNLEESLALFRAIGDDGNAANALFDLGQAAVRHGDYGRAENLIEESRALYEKVDDRRGKGETLCMLAQIAVFQGDPAAATELAEAARGFFDELGDQYGTSWSLLVLGERSYSHDDLETAEALFERALVLSEEIGNAQFVANSLQGLGEVATARENWTSAYDLFRRSLDINWRIGDTLFVAGVLASMAGLAAARGHHRRAAMLWGADAALRATIGTPPPPPRQRGPRYQRMDEELQRAAREALGLGAEAFDAVWTEGMALGAERAVDYARGDD